VDIHQLGVAENAYGTTDTKSKAFQDAGDWVGVMFMVYNGISALAAFLLPYLPPASAGALPTWFAL
jgi:hypothetical protein